MPAIAVAPSSMMRKGRSPTADRPNALQEVMMRQRPRNLLIGIALVTVAATAVLTVDQFLPARRPHAEEFQRLLGGLGLGPAIDLAGCPMCFDPRVSFICREDVGALPGGRFFCRHHACSVLRLPPISLDKDDMVARDE